MGEPVADSKVPVFVALGCILAGLAIGAIGSPIFGGIVAAAGALPGLFGMWKGIQQETQTTLGLSVGAVLVALAVGAVLIILGIVHWVT